MNNYCETEASAKIPVNFLW